MYFERKIFLKTIAITLPDPNTIPTIHLTSEEAGGGQLHQYSIHEEKIWELLL